MQRVARIWLCFALLGAVAGFATYFTIVFVLLWQSWLGLIAGWLVGLLTGLVLAQFRWARDCAVNLFSALARRRYWRS